MIRNFQTADLEQVLQIWLEANIQAHSFIAPAYWESHYESVKLMLPQATVYVYEC